MPRLSANIISQYSNHRTLLIVIARQVVDHSEHRIRCLRFNETTIFYWRISALRTRTHIWPGVLRIRAAAVRATSVGKPFVYVCVNELAYGF